MKNKTKQVFKLCGRAIEPEQKSILWVVLGDTNRVTGPRERLTGLKINAQPKYRLTEDCFPGKKYVFQIKMYFFNNISQLLIWCPYGLQHDRRGRWRGDQMEQFPTKYNEPCVKYTGVSFTKKEKEKFHPTVFAVATIFKGGLHFHTVLLINIY